MNTRLKQMSTVLSKHLKNERQMKVNKEIMKYVDLRNNRYFLNISKEECRQIGISPLEYKMIVLNLEKTNRFIAKVEKDKKQEIKRNTLLSKNIKTRGTIRTNGQEVGSEAIWVQEGYSTVHFECRTNVVLAAGYTCKVDNFGGTKFKTGTGSSFGFTSIDIPLDASNTSARFYFLTTDPNGGHANWELRK